jgi:hypothetical protein
MRKMARPRDSHAVKQLMGIKARATKRLQDTLEYLEWLPVTTTRHDQRRTPRNTQTPLDELHTRLTQLIEEVEYTYTERQHQELRGYCCAETATCSTPGSRPTKTIRTLI